MDLFSIIILKKINIELLSIRIENTSRLKIFNPWTLRETPEEDHSSKKPKVEAGKKQRIEVVKELHAAMIRSVKFGEDEFYTMDKTMTQTTTMMTKILLMMFGWMKTPCSLVEFLKRFGQMPLRTKPQDHQSSGLTSLQMRLKSQGF